MSKLSIKYEHEHDELPKLFGSSYIVKNVNDQIFENPFPYGPMDPIA